VFTISFIAPACGRQVQDDKQTKKDHSTSYTSFPLEFIPQGGAGMTWGGFFLNKKI